MIAHACPQCGEVLGKEDIHDDTLRCPWCGHLAFIGVVSYGMRARHPSSSTRAWLQLLAYGILLIGFVEPLRVLGDQVLIQFSMMALAVFVFYRWTTAWLGYWAKLLAKEVDSPSKTSVFTKRLLYNPVFLIPYLAYLGVIIFLDLIGLFTALMGLGYIILALLVLEDNLNGSPAFFQ